uniref:Kinesin motor domain-containing protein n=1 Tax=Steinernema glaseri TaxID=37863 RepID=A0A1I7XZM2_9BILA
MSRTRLQFHLLCLCPFQLEYSKRNSTSSVCFCIIHARVDFSKNEVEDCTDLLDGGMFQKSSEVASGRPVNSSVFQSLLRIPTQETENRHATTGEYQAANEMIR